jgi:ferric-dicitrate binding protein FerR (iron transport regulator)
LKKGRGKRMKKGLAFLAVVIVVIAVGYTSINWNSDTQSSTQANQDVSLRDGETIKLTAEEAALTAGQGEKKVILTDLGMF